jgi:hypothetical protein
VRDLRIVVATDRFPELSETFVTAEIEALRALGHEVRVESVSEASRPNPGAAAGVDVSVYGHDGRRRKLLDLAWLVARHPRRADSYSQRRWRK